MEKIKNGFHTICGYSVFVKDGYITHLDGFPTPMRVFRKDRTKLGIQNNHLIPVEKITPGAFRACIRRKTIVVKIPHSREIEYLDDLGMDPYEIEI